MPDSRKTGGHDQLRRSSGEDDVYTAEFDFVPQPAGANAQPNVLDAQRRLAALGPAPIVIPRVPSPGLRRAQRKSSRKVKHKRLPNLPLPL